MFPGGIGPSEPTFPPVQPYPRLPLAGGGMGWWDPRTPGRAWPEPQTLQPYTPGVTATTGPLDRRYDNVLSGCAGCGGVDARQITIPGWAILAGGAALLWFLLK